MKLARSDQAFTLIELMIVILILAILIAIAVPVYLRSQDNASQRACQANIRTVDGAIQSYQSEQGSYPLQVSDMVAAPTQVLKKVPSCPLGPDDYVTSPTRNPPSFPARTRPITSYR